MPPVRSTPKLTGYATLSAAGLLAAVATQRPAFAALAVPFLLTLVVALVLPAPAAVRVGARPHEPRVREGDRTEVGIRIDLDDPAPQVEVLVVPKPGVEVLAPGGALALDVAGTARRDLSVPVVVTRWGAVGTADVVVRTRDLLGFFVRESRHTNPTKVRVHPRVETLRRTVRPLDTQVFAGNQTAREMGEGIELADLRPYTSGDRMRDVNWRVTARRGDVWVNRRHPDRNADVVILLDAFSESHLDDAVRAAAMLVARYLRGRDRVGLVTYGGTMRWILPRGGERELHRLVDALIESHVFESDADKSIDVVPRRALPPEALVLALTPLEDGRMVDALEQLRVRGRDVAVVEVTPRAPVPDGSDPTDVLVHRLWHLNRRAVRDRLRGLGIAVAEWPVADDGTRPPLEALGEEVRSWRRRSARAG